MYFLIHYDRARGALVSIEEYAGDAGDRVRSDRLAAELAYHREHRYVEVVFLEAADMQALKKTHRRYFESLTELVDTAP